MAKKGLQRRPYEMDQHKLYEIIEEYHEVFGVGDCTYDVNEVLIDENTYLHKAVSQGKIEYVTLLLGNGADPNAVGDMGDTPLHNAVTFGRLEIVSTLIANGAKQVRNEFGKYPIQCVGEDMKEADAKYLKMILHGA